MKLAKVLPILVLFAVSTMAMGDVIDDLTPAFRLVADDLDATLNDGDPVVTWVDQVQGVVLDENPPSYDTWAAIDQSPTFKTSVMNGHDVVRFDETGQQWLWSGNESQLIGENVFNADGNTILVVYSLTADEVQSAEGAKLVEMATVNDAGCDMRNLGISQMRVFWNGSVPGDETPGELAGQAGGWAGGGFDTVPVPGEVPMLAMYRICRTTPTTDEDYVGLWSNGVFAGAGLAMGTGSVTKAIGLGGTPFWYGSDPITGDPVGPFDFLDGDIAEVIIFARALNDADRAVASNYLLNQYNIPEPGTMVLLGLGGLALIRRRK